MESEATPTVEANFRPPETRGNFSVETPADSGVMDINSQEYAEYKSGVEAADQARLAEVRADLAGFIAENLFGYEKSNNSAETENVALSSEEPNYFDEWGDYKKLSHDYEVVDGQYIVEYVPKDVLGSSFGMAYVSGGHNYAQVREDLPPRVKNFVKAHELYHLQDTKGGGVLMHELRANLMPALKDPIGLLTTIKASLTKERLSLYFDRFKNKY